MKLTYIYHSCFVLEGDGVTLIFDYYKDTAEKGGVVHDLLLNRPGRFYVLCSHSHADHFTPEILAWKKIRPDIRTILSKDILDCGKAKEADAVYLDKGGVYRDAFLTVEAFGSTDLGISFLIEMEGCRIFHAGDLNNWHWNEESTQEEAEGYEQNYLKELELLAQKTDQLDVAMFPVDPRLGKDYMRGAQQFIDRIKTAVFAPMHFDQEYRKANAFKVYAESRGCRFMTLSYKGESMDVCGRHDKSELLKK